MFSGATFCPETPVFDSQASGKNSRVLVPNSSHDSIDGSARINRTSISEDEDDNDRLPDLEEQIRKENELRKKEQAQKALREKKLLWAAQQRKAEEERKKKATALFEDEDDEEELEIEGTMVDSQAESLEIVESQHGRFNTGEHLRKAVVKDRVHAAISPFKPSSVSKAPKEFRHPRKSMPTTDSFIEYVGKTDLLGVKSKPPPPKSRASMPMIKKLSTFGPLDLKGQLLKDVRLMDAKTRRERDEEWEGRGGHAGRRQQIEQVAKLKQLGGEKTLGEWAKKGLEVAETDEMARAEAEYEDEEEGDEEDEDYKPEEQEADAEMTGDEPQEENDATKVERSRSSSMEPPTEDEDKENRVIEDKENVPPPRKARAALADKDDLFSPHQPSEAEDEPEDKENAPPPRDQDEDEDEVDDEDLFGLRPLKKHTARRIVADEEDEDEDVAAPSKDENVPPRRSPLKFDAFDDDDEPPRPAGLPFGGAGGKMLMFNSSAESLDDGGAENEQTAVDKGDGFDMTDAEIEGDGFTQLFALDSVSGSDILPRSFPD